MSILPISQVPKRHLALADSGTHKIKFNGTLAAVPIHPAPCMLINMHPTWSPSLPDDGEDLDRRKSRMASVRPPVRQSAARSSSSALRPPHRFKAPEREEQPSQTPRSFFFFFKFSRKMAHAPAALNNSRRNAEPPRDFEDLGMLPGTEYFPTPKC